MNIYIVEATTGSAWEYHTSVLCAYKTEAESQNEVKRLEEVITHKLSYAHYNRLMDKVGNLCDMIANNTSNNPDEYWEKYDELFVHFSKKIKIKYPQGFDDGDTTTYSIKELELR